ncbi:O-antigen ligase family protein [Chenggangzhangella methanolivorans]|uniref:O-antigen ligase family protein n=1 Tax=Chenggangzhangella methanolivorans TaxID=1437009 RepID=A0A9E6UP54_9HYPH|nr:O-antigen ligase [Chenggangzhangella methanolivorans]QZO01024.1 O-antigen ligase family protein [Chenggangzhangella methanolivorans]
MSLAASPPISPPAAASTEGFGFGAFLFAATLLFYLITTTPFADLTALASVDAAAEKSNRINQLVFLGLTGATWIAGLMSPMRGEIMRPRILIFMMLLWFVGISVISSNAGLAVKQVILATLTIVNASVFLLLPRTDGQFARLMAFGFLAMLALSYWGVAFMPRYAIHQADEIREPINAGLWRGHFMHKNVAAAMMVLAAFVGMFTWRMGMKIRGAILVVGALFFLAHTGGKAATGSLPAVLIIAWIFERFPIARAPIVLGGAALFNFIAIGSAGYPSINEFVTSLGIDPTFTNRSDVWRVGFAALSEQPWTGHGFQSFWQTDEMLAKAGRGRDWAYAAFNGHNGFLDLALTTGIPGFILALTWILVLPLRDVSRAKRTDNNPAVTTLFIRIWLYGIFQACLESVFFQSGSPLWVMMMVAVFGLRLQARADVVSDRPETPPLPA